MIGVSLRPVFGAEPGIQGGRPRMKRNVVAAMAAGTAVAALMWVAAASVAQAQSFPARPITLIVPWPAGGTTDIGLRALATATEKHLGQSIVIENRPGGSG